jgi:hypothetical protein
MSSSFMVSIENYVLFKASLSSIISAIAALRFRCSFCICSYGVISLVEVELLVSVEHSWVTGTWIMEISCWAVVSVCSLASCNLLGCLSLVWPCIWEIPSQHSNTDGTVPGFKVLRPLNWWYSKSSFLKCSEQTHVWCCTYRHNI